MIDPLRPSDAKEVEGAVQAALADGKTLEIVGRGSKRAVGRAAQWDATLDLSGLSGITLYEPAELVLSARAGTPMAEIEAAVSAHGQELAFEAMDVGPIFGMPAGLGTLGGVLAANLSGPRRIKAGAARDHFLGFTAVSGRGETFKSGGRVVKNVTGYDLSKLLAGSWGTLAVMTDVTIKVLPRAESEETLVLTGLDYAAAVEAMSAAMGSMGEVSGAAHAPASVARRLPVPAGMAGRSATLLRLEGVPPSIAHRRRILEQLLGPFGSVAALAEQESRVLWRTVRDAGPFALHAPLEGEGRIAAGDPGRGHASGPPPDALRAPTPGQVGGRLSHFQGEVKDQRPLWRISTAPTQGPKAAQAIAAQTDAEFLYDWAGGLIWAELAPSDDAGAALVRTAVNAAGGHATLIRAPAAVRAAVPVFDPQDAMVATLTKRIKEQFDPKGVLNPGRMYAGV